MNSNLFPAPQGIIQITMTVHFELLLFTSNFENSAPIEASAEVSSVSTVGSGTVAIVAVVNLSLSLWLGIGRPGTDKSLN